MNKQTERIILIVFLILSLIWLGLCIISLKPYLNNYNYEGNQERYEKAIEKYGS